MDLPERTAAAPPARGAHLNLLVVDHETATRSALTSMCVSCGVQVVGEADSGIAAIAAVEKLRPDVVLLDVELPDMTGFEVLRAARREATPLAIMVSAHARRDDRTLHSNVVDYLVKPVGAARFAESIDRVRQRCRSNVTWLETSRATPPAAPPRSFEAFAGATELLIGERQHRLYVLKPQTVEYIEAQDNYVLFHVGDAQFISRDTVRRLTRVLAGCGFVRIERSLLLNIGSIVYAQRAGRGTYAFTLTSGACVQSGATYLEGILRTLPLAGSGVRVGRRRREAL